VLATFLKRPVDAQELVVDCPRKHSPGLSDPWVARYPQLPALFG